MFRILFATSFALFHGSAFAEPLTTTIEEIVVQDVSKSRVRAEGNRVKKTDKDLAGQSGTRWSQTVEEANVEFIGGPRPSAELPQIRGLDATRVLILDNGVRQNFQSTHTARLFSAASDLESVEIIKGPWSALYGSGAMGGVVSITRMNARGMQRRHNKIRGAELSLSAHTNNDLRALRLTGFGRTAANVDLLLSAASHQAGDFLTGQGEAEPIKYSGTQQQDIYFSAMANPTADLQWQLKSNVFDENTTAPLNPASTLLTASSVGETALSKRDLILEVTHKNGWTARPFVRTTEVKKNRLSGGRRDAYKVETTGIDLWRTWQTETVEQIAGLDVFQDVNRGTRNGGSLNLFPSGISRQMGAYYQLSYLGQLPVRITPGLRYDQFENDPESTAYAKNTGNRLSKKLYLDWILSESSTLFLGYGEAFNAPRLQDLYADSTHFPGNFFVANPELKPEQAGTVEVGYRGEYGEQNSGSSVDITLFETQAKDFIQRNITQTTTTFSNAARVRLQGLEAKWQLRRDLWDAGLSYSLVRSRDLNELEPLYDTPADTLRGQLGYRATEQWRFSGSLTWAQKQDRIPTPSGIDQGVLTTATGEWARLDLDATYQSGPWALQARLRNATDRLYRRHASNLNEPGRDLQLNLRRSF